jgi:hypothetical protein
LGTSGYTEPEPILAARPYGKPAAFMWMAVALTIESDLPLEA